MLERKATPKNKCPLNAGDPFEAVKERFLFLSGVDLIFE